MQPACAVSGWYWPDGHAVATEAPERFTNDPAGAGVHAESPVTPANLPTAHGTAPDCPAAATNEPSGACWQAVEDVAPAAVLNVPATHSVGCDAPVVAT